MPKLNKSFINQIKDEIHKDKVYTDDEIKKLNIRIQGNKKTWVLIYRINGHQKKLSLGSIFERTPDSVRAEAIDLLNMINRGIDPAQEKKRYQEEMNVKQLCELYMKEGVAHKKQSTLKIDEGRITHHINPIIGNIKLSELNTGDIEKMMIKIINGDVKSAKESEKKRGRSIVTGGSEAANRTVQLLSAILNFAIHRELIDKNPAKYVKRPASHKKEIFLTIEEIKKLGLALADPQHADKKTAINAIKLILLTGCRKTEILSLRWDYIDFNSKCFRFPDTKTGKQTRAFGEAAKNLLEELKRKTNSDWVFPATRGNGFYIGLPKTFHQICYSHPLGEDGKPDLNKSSYITKADVSLHTLRHSFATIANSLNFNDFTIAGMIGHKIGGVTRRYSHDVDEAIVMAADKVSEYISKALEGK